MTEGTRTASWEGNREVAIPTTPQFLTPHGLCQLLCSSSAWHRVSNPQWRSHFHTSNILQQPRKATTATANRVRHKAPQLERLDEGEGCLVTPKHVASQGQATREPQKGLKTCSSRSGASPGQKHRLSQWELLQLWKKSESYHHNHGRAIPTHFL